MKGSKRELKFEINVTGDVPSAQDYKIPSDLDIKLRKRLNNGLESSRQKLKQVASHCYHI